MGNEAPRPIVYVVDDDASLLRALRRLLLASGFDVQTFSSAECLLDAKADWKTGGWDARCLLLDVYLGGLNGFELQERLVNRGLCAPVVFMTAHDDVSIRERARKVGAIAYLLKPFDDQSLIAAIRGAVASTRPSAHIGGPERAPDCPQGGSEAPRQSLRRSS